MSSKKLQEIVQLIYFLSDSLRFLYHYVLEKKTFGCFPCTCVVGHETSFAVIEVHQGIMTDWTLKQNIHARKLMLIIVITIMIHTSSGGGTWLDGVIIRGLVALIQHAWTEYVSACGSFWTLGLVYMCDEVSWRCDPSLSTEFIYVSYMPYRQESSTVILVSLYPVTRGHSHAGTQEDSSLGSFQILVFQMRDVPSVVSS